MGYVGILLIAILISFAVVRIGGLALQLTGMEPEVARFQALSAFTGTGFTTNEAERVVRNRARRRIITILIILGSAGLVTIIGTLVASFTQVTGYGWFFIRLAVIIAGSLILYQLVLRSRIGYRMLYWLRRPLARFIIRESPDIEEIFSPARDWSVSLVVAREGSRSAGCSLAEVAAEAGELEILAVERAEALLPRPPGDERIQAGDRLLVYGSGRALKRLVA